MTREEYLEEMVEDIDMAVQDLDQEYMAGLDEDELAEYLHDELWVSDSVTGNGSGSYTFSTYQAEENIAHAQGLIMEAFDEFGNDYGDLLSRGAEFADVTIRCYLLGEAIQMWLEQQ